MHIEQRAGFKKGDGPTDKLDKVEKLFGAVTEEPWLIAELLSLPTERYKTLDLTPEKRKAETISLLLRHIESLANTSPVILIIEDVHWIDYSTRVLSMY